MQTYVSNDVLALKDRNPLFWWGIPFSCLSACELSLQLCFCKVSLVLPSVLVNYQPVSLLQGTVVGNAVAEIGKVHVGKWGGRMETASRGVEWTASPAWFFGRSDHFSYPFSPHSVMKHVMPHWIATFRPLVLDLSGLDLLQNKPVMWDTGCSDQSRLGMNVSSTLFSRTVYISDAVVQRGAIISIKTCSFPSWSSLPGRPSSWVGWQVPSAVIWVRGGSWWRVVLGTAVLRSQWLSGGQQAEILGAVHVCRGKAGGKLEEGRKAPGPSLVERE